MVDSTPLFINRDLSWLEFNHRVLEEAQDAGNPPLERVKFLAIAASNLDEFFMVRVGGLQILFDQGRTDPDPSGLTVEEQLNKISWRVHTMVAEQYAALRELETELAAHGLRHLAPDALTPGQAQYLEQLFEHELAPLLTPLAVRSPREFPRLPGLGLCLGVVLAPPRAARGRTRAPRFAIVPIPKALRRFISLESERGLDYALAEDVIIAHVERLFAGETVLDAAAFRITRNADMAVREDQANDLLVQMRRVLRERVESACVRLELSASAGAELRTFLKTALDVPSRDLYEIAGPIGLSAWMSLSRTPGFDALRGKTWEPRAAALAGPTERLFDVLSRQNVVLSHPFDSFDPVVRLLEEAAADPDVLAIKQTLYRTSLNSPVVAALARAAQNGKEVTAVVELKARFDEARNIARAEVLEQAGAQVVYGIRGLKTHAKICLIVRREPTGIRRYLHFGTGNYNEQTARLYTDISFMTCDADLGADASLFFNTITGYSQPVKYRKLEAAPLGLRERLVELIDGEAVRARQGQKARIVAKLNSLVDPALIQALYRASQEGVTIELIIRGICCLRAGVPGLSETISVLSIVDQFLEHSRILYFHHGGEPRVFISSADWMPRNLDRRIELLVPVEDGPSQDRLVAILETGLRDTVRGRRLLPDGHYVRAHAPGAAPLRSQETLCREAAERARDAELARRRTFEPYRATPPEPV